MLFLFLSSCHPDHEITFVCGTEAKLFLLTSNSVILGWGDDFFVFFFFFYLSSTCYQIDNNYAGYDFIKTTFCKADFWTLLA